MKKLEITEKKFKRFLKLQHSGIINMNDVQAGCCITRLTEDEYLNIIFNYKDLVKKYGNKL